MGKINKKIIFISMFSILILGVGCYFIYDNVVDNNEDNNNVDSKYVLEKYIDNAINSSKNDKVYLNDGIIFLDDIDNDTNYLNIYSSDGKDITPEEINNKKLEKKHPVIVDDKFLGYIVRIGNKGYYINNKGEIVFDVVATYIKQYYDANFIEVETDEICYTSSFDGTTYDYYYEKIYDLEGNLLIDGVKEEYTDIRLVYDLNNISLFEVVKDRKYGVIDKNGNIIIDFKYEPYIEYEEVYNTLFASRGDFLYDIYDLNGEFLKTVNSNDIKIEKENQEDFGVTLSKKKSRYLNDTIYLLDDKYELKRFDNVYYGFEGGMDTDGIKFFITDYIYIRDNSNIYTVHSLDGEKIIDDEFEFIGNTNISGNAVGLPNDYILLCKNKDKTNCGAIDFKGNILIGFENELYKFDEGAFINDFNGFKKGNEYFDYIDGNVTKKLICDNLEDTYIWKYFENVVVVEDEKIEFDDGGNKLIDYNCKDLSDPVYYNIYKYGNFIVAQRNNWVSYDVYDSNGKIIKFEDKDGVGLYNFIGYSDGKLYFTVYGNIYVLKEKE